MKIQGHNNTLETNVEAETQNFSIGDESLIIGVLRNHFYEHKIRTPAQEYICNARDAMREVGKGNQFEITVPTQLNPKFKVRDFGPGISPDRVRDVFVKYGASTKRDTNNQTGGFGIGAKSAFAYTDSFTVVSIVDGFKRTYVAHTGLNNNGRFDLIETVSTDEPNGTEIEFGVRPYDVHEFKAAIYRAIYFWDDKPIIKGDLNPPVLVKGEVVSDLLEVIDREMLPEYVRVGYGEDMIAVVDGVPYFIHEKLSGKIKALVDLNNLCKKTVILHFCNGLVEFVANRESIADSKFTLANLEKIGQKALLEAKTHISDAFGAIKDTPTYLRTYAKLSKVFDVDEFAKYGGYCISSSVIENPLFSKVKMTVVHCMGKYGRGRVDKITKDELTSARSKIEIDRLDHLFFVTKQDNKLVQNKRIREYFKKYTHMILLEVLDTSVPKMDKATGKPVLDKDNKQVFEPISYPKEFQQIVAELGAKDFCSITYVDPPKVVKEKVKREDEALCLHGTRYGTRHLYTTLAKNTQKWIYVPLDEGSWPNKCTREHATDLSEYTSEGEDTKVCGLGAKAVKMVQGDPNFISFDDWMKAFKPTKDLILAAKVMFARNDSSINALCNMVKELEDPFLVEMCDEYKAIAKAKTRSVPELIANKILEEKEVKEFKEADEKFGKLMQTEYPLIKDHGEYSRNKKELIFYANAKYKARKGK
jgi:hypothetical protein